jgi:hypothetical protein
MQRRNFLKNIAGLGAVAAVPAGNLLAADNSIGAGNIKGKVVSNGKGLAGVVVSDGYTVTATDKMGAYQLPLHSDAKFVFVTIPSGYHIPHEKGIARFYQRISKDQPVQTANFTLQKNEQDDNKHVLIVWADTQMVKDENAVELINVSAPDTAAVARSFGNIPVHGISVGDLVHDRADLYDEYSKAVEATGIPYFQIIGNHDQTYIARGDDGSQETFHSLFGPGYFSFNRGKVHYVFLDDVFFIGKGHNYMGYLTESQLNWLEQDLKYVPAGSTVIVSLHIPTFTDLVDREKLKEEPGGSMVSNREHLYHLLKPYQVHIMSGHTHWNENWEKDNIMEHNHGTVCGAWWRPQAVAVDGTPNGYAVYEINGSEVTWYYKGTGKPKEYQMSLYAPGKVAAKPNAVVANVWNYDKKWKVEFLEDGVSKGAMEQIRCQDPISVASFPVNMHVYSDHFFAAVPSAGVKEVTVKVTDRFGRVYQDKLQLS